MPFNKKYSVTATSNKTYIDATSGNNLHLFIVVNRGAAIYGDTDFVNYVVVNEGEKEYKNVIISLSGEAVEYNGEDKDVEVDGNKVMIDTLGPHEWLPLRAVIESYGKPLEESNLDYHINYIRGRNLGMEITVVEELPDMYYNDGEVDAPYGHLKWVVQYGVLTVEGTGDYADPALAPSQVVAPWHDGETEKHIGIAEIDVKDMTLTTAMFEDCTKLSSFDFKNGTEKVKNMSRMFKNCKFLSSVPMKKLKSYEVRDLSYMFMGCTSLYSLDGSNFYTYYVTDVTGLFENCSNLSKLDLSGWNFIEVVDVNNVFSNCNKLKEILAPLHSKTNVKLPVTSENDAWYREEADQPALVFSIGKDNTSKRYYRTLKEVDNTPTITVQYYGYDNSHILPYDRAYKSGQKIELPDPPQRIINGSVFRGWYTQPNGTGKQYENEEVLTSEIDTTRIIYGYWEETEPDITYDANGGTGAPAPEYSDGVNGLYISRTEPTRPGYLFTGWNEEPERGKYVPDYAEPKFYPGQEVKPVDYKKTLYANWVNANDYYRVDLYNYDKPNGITKLCLANKNSKRYLDYITLPWSQGIEPERIEGWYLTPSLVGSKYEPMTEYRPTNNAKLYAKWVSYNLEYVTIKYDLNYEGCPKNTIPDDKMYKNNPYIIPDIWPERDGYVFVGWLTDEHDADLGTGGIMPGEDSGILYKAQTLYASWTECNNYAVRKRLQGDYGDKIFPNSYFNGTLLPTWVEMPKKDAVVCLKTEVVYYGDEKIRKDYHTKAVVFYIKNNQFCVDQYLKGGEIGLKPSQTIYDMICVELSTKSGINAQLSLLQAAKNKAGYDYAIGKIPLIGDAVGIIDTIGAVCQYAYDIVTYFNSHGKSFEALGMAFVDKYKDAFEENTIRGILRIAEDVYDCGGSYLVPSDEANALISFTFEVVEIILNDVKYRNMNIPGDSYYAVGSMMDLMREAEFGENIVQQTPKKIKWLTDKVPATKITIGDICKTLVGFKCPVDVKVYDSTGALVGYIKDNVPQEIEGGIKTEVDEIETKLVYMDGNEQYKLEIIATDDGEVTCYTQTYNNYTKTVSNIRTYSDMKVKKGDVIYVDVSPVVQYATSEEGGCKAETPVKLVINDGEEVEATVVQKGNQIVTYNVTAESSNEEAGTVTGGGSFYNGEFCKVTAEAKDGYEFKGWMENGQLISSDAEYRFEVNADHSIIAEFTKKNTSEGGNSGGSSGGNSGGSSGGSSGGYSGGGSSGGYSGGGSSGGYSGGGSAGGTSGGTGNGGNAGGNTGTGNTGNGGSGKSDGKDGDTSKEFEVKVGAVYTDENGIRYEITAIKGTKKATSNAVKYIGPDKSGVKKIVIPNSVIIEGNVYIVSELGTEWTKGNKKLTTVVINDNIKKIPTDAFKGCKALKKVTFGKNITTIGTRAFYGCTKLKTVKLPANLTKIGSKAFYGCTAMESITIPSQVESISSYAFYRCTKLYKVTIKSKHLTEKKIGKKAFAGIVTNAVIKVPKAVIDKYTDLLKKAGVTKDMTVTK